MTILVVVKTGSAVVMAADSKLTTQSVAGINEDGSPNFILQTYDHAVKITLDHDETALAAFAGNGTIGEINATDYFSTRSANLAGDRVEQDKAIKEMLGDMVETRKQFFLARELSPDQAPFTIALIAAAPRGERAPRVWRLELNGFSGEVNEILENSGVWFEGQNDNVLSLFYGYRAEYIGEVKSKLDIDEEKLMNALNEMSFNRPVAQVNFITMPV